MTSINYGDVKRTITTFEDVVKRYQNILDAYTKTSQKTPDSEEDSNDPEDKLDIALRKLHENAKNPQKMESKILEMIIKQLNKMPASVSPTDKVFLDALQKQKEILAQLKERGTCYAAESKTEIDGSIVNVEIERFERTGERSSKVYNNSFIIEINNARIKAKNAIQSFVIENPELALSINPILEQMLEGKFTQEEAEKFKTAFSLVTNALKNNAGIPEEEMTAIKVAFAELEEEAAKGL